MNRAKHKRLTRHIAFVPLFFGGQCSAAQTAEHAAVRRITIPGGPGAFNWIMIDDRSDRLFAPHKGTKSLAVIDVKTESSIASIDVGAALGAAIDSRDHRLFVGCEEEHKIVVLNSASLARLGEIPCAGEVGAVLYCPANGLLYAVHDDGSEVWVFSLTTERLTATIPIPAGPEMMVYDPHGGRIFVAVKSDNSVQEIDPQTNHVVRSIDTSPAASPHGLAVDSAGRRLFVAGRNGKLVTIDLSVGKVTCAADIEAGAHQIALDPGRRRLYCACDTSLSVLDTGSAGALFVRSIKLPPHSRSVAVDPRNHSVWICGYDEEKSYAMIAPQ